MKVAGALALMLLVVPAAAVGLIPVVHKYYIYISILYVHVLFTAPTHTCKIIGTDTWLDPQDIQESKL